MTLRFILTFLIGFSIFIAINLTSAHVSSDCGLVAVFGMDSCADDIARAGWPLRFYEEGGFDYHRTVKPDVLTLDIVFGVFASAFFGWILARRVK